jgi:hypothetical protein
VWLVDWEFAQFLEFLRGFLGKVGGWGWFFAGKNVVGCVVNVVFWQSFFRVEKIRQLSELFFLPTRFARCG